ncbi:MAG: hypothetical protein OWS74_07740 [Firmicutes bacterium]|nr:hypothetical protein [Bacillota bacterium]
MPPTIDLLIPESINRNRPAACRAAVRLIERRGFSVSLPALPQNFGNTAFDAGHLEQARQDVRHVLQSFHPDSLHNPVLTLDPRLVPFMRRHYSALAPDSAAETAAHLAHHVQDISWWLADHSLPLSASDRNPQPAAFLSACSARYGSHAEAHVSQWLNTLPLAISPVLPPDRCCAYDPLFSQSEPKISRQLFDEILHAINGHAAATVITLDPICVIQLQQYAQKRQQPLTLTTLLEWLDQWEQAAIG